MKVRRTKYSCALTDWDAALPVLAKLKNTGDCQLVIMLVNDHLLYNDQWDRENQLEQTRRVIHFKYSELDNQIHAET